VRFLLFLDNKKTTKSIKFDFIEKLSLIKTAFYVFFDELTNLFLKYPKDNLLPAVNLISTELSIHL